MSRSSRMAILVSFALVFGLAPVAATAAPVSPTPGSYAFVVSRAGEKSGDSSITVKNASGGLTVHETETFPGITDVVDETLDGNDLMPASYVSSFPLTSDVGVTIRLSFYAGGARETVDGTSGATDFKVETGTQRMVVLDGVMMTGFLFLPAQIKALSLTRFTTLAPSRADTYDCRTDMGPTPDRPAGIPASDVSLTVDGTSPAGTVEFSEWYDPATMIVDEVDVPGEQVTIARVRSK